MEHQNLFLMPVWRALGKTRWVLQARTLPKTLSIAGGVLLVLLVLGIWPARFTLESKGTLEPVVRQDVFAGIDGVVQDLYCDHGDMVAKDKTLVQLRNTDLEVAIAEVQGKRMANNEELSSIQQPAGRREENEPRRAHPAGRQTGGGKTESANPRQAIGPLRGEEAGTESQQPHQRAGGHVGFAEERLPIGRPVQRGQVLLRVADPEGPWQLELHMPENRMGHIVEAQQALYDASREKLADLLREDARAKLGDAATEEEVQKAADAALAEVPDEKLHDRILAEFRKRLASGLETILKDVTDADLRAKLGEVLRDGSYDGAREKLQRSFPTWRPRTATCTPS